MKLQRMGHPHPMADSGKGNAKEEADSSAALRNDKQEVVSLCVSMAKPSSLLETRVIYCGDNLEQLKKLPDACVDLIYIDPPFNSNRNYEVFWGETKEKRSFDDRHESTKAYWLEARDPTHRDQAAMNGPPGFERVRMKSVRREERIPGAEARIVDRRECPG